MQAAIRVWVWIGLLTAAQMAAGQGPSACLADLVAARCPQEVSTADPMQVCRWEFGYRAPEAGALYDELAQSVQACLGAIAERAPDAPVNHPDSYDLRQFVSGDVAVSVALKDKASLNQTLVFLRVEPVE